MQLQWSFIVLFTRRTLSGKLTRFARDSVQCRSSSLRTVNTTPLVLTVNIVRPVFKAMLVKALPLTADQLHPFQD